jgi:hypothetical protein
MMQFSNDLPLPTSSAAEGTRRRYMLTRAPSAFDIGDITGDTPELLECASYLEREPNWIS